MRRRCTLERNNELLDPFRQVFEQTTYVQTASTTPSITIIYRIQFRHSNPSLRSPNPKIGQQAFGGVEMRRRNLNEQAEPKAGL